MKACVLGSGVMGTGIVSVLIGSDEIENLYWYGRNSATLDKSLEAVRKSTLRSLKKQGRDATECDSLLNKIKIVTEINEIEASDIYIEAVVEELDAKLALFKELNKVIPQDALVASNTSSLSITALAMCIENPNNFIGIHFFNPTSVMKLVEVVVGLTTADSTLERALEFVNGLGKEPVIVNESPGFIVNRMLIPMINEAVSIFAEGIASKEDIDKAMKYGANHPIGPLQLADLIGNDVCLSIMETLHTETGDPKYRAHPLLRQYVRANYLGRKSGKGFYEY
ncbi:3-hydroxybutyryl-CoA dehydrogenase [Pseudoalteromonas luteoviolacea]|uniref:3-hydroxybutyryl-CoA dehydrogenase n=1 Tax=Pseudoalteromonas luteoviolacea TaxID=43657 RepID=A0A1C0TMV4_9GAMM|nr:3-hydroxyacyl-CoA dehydrogenase NAD-binding domain-containing protein [Pseudoalteromonas luteoviolacea]OCQ20180.1 3-hydroxybutyryl-CoA dehydrogenase [Pseudoalteromonas luteoviolacea]